MHIRKTVLKVENESMNEGINKKQREMERAEGLESEVIRRISVLNLIAWTSVLMFFVLTGL